MQKFTKEGKKRQKKGATNADFSRTEISTANPMVVGCVQHYSTHFIKKLGKLFEPFFHKVQNTAKKGQKKATNWAKMLILAYFLPSFHFWPIFFHFEQNKQIKN